MLVGLEIEIESDRLNDYHLIYWDIVDEGSLRGGVELISYAPYNDAKVRNSLEEIDKLVKNKPHITAGERCSVHVHLDMRELSPKRRVIGILNYLLLEKELYRISGDRIESEFAIPLADNSYFKKGLSRCIPYPSRKELPITSKYQGLNTQPILSLGSIEIRIHEGCLDTGRIYRWINLLKRLWDGKLIRRRTTRDYLLYLANHSIAVATEILQGDGNTHPILNIDVIAEILYLSRVKNLDTYS